MSRRQTAVGSEERQLHGGDPYRRRVRSPEACRHATAVDAALLLAATLFAGLTTAIPHPAVAATWDEHYFPNHELSTHEGKQVAFYEELIRDKIVVIDFIYATCPDICSLSTARLAQVRAMLGDRVGRDIHMYSISLDPANDTPAVLAKYASAFDTGSGWTFLTGDVDEVAEIRYKLGERSRNLEEHRADVVIGNARTGEWERSSIFQEIERLARTILDMDPQWRALPVERIQESRAAAFPSDFNEHAGQSLFVKACSACHTIGGGVRVGPDLLDVAKRRESAWLERYLAAPARLREEGDAIALKLTARYEGVAMPNLGLSGVDIGDLLDYIARRSAEPDSIVVGTGHAIRPGRAHAGEEGQDGHDHGGGDAHDHSTHDH